MLIWPLPKFLLSFWWIWGFFFQPIHLHRQHFGQDIESSHEQLPNANTKLGINSRLFTSQICIEITRKQAMQLIISQLPLSLWKWRKYEQTTVIPKLLMQYFFKPKLKLKVYTSIASWLLHFKAIVVVYESKITKKYSFTVHILMDLFAFISSYSSKSDGSSSCFLYGIKTTKINRIWQPGLFQKLLGLHLDSYWLRHIWNRKSSDAKINTVKYQTNR